jgi:hypothetical protein
MRRAYGSRTGCCAHGSAYSAAQRMIAVTAYMRRGLNFIFVSHNSLLL